MPFTGAAAEADVRLRAPTGPFKADMREIRVEYARTTGSMSTESLHAATSQEKLDRVLRRYGSTSYQAKQATLAYRRELEHAAASSAPRFAHEVERDERAVRGFARGAVVGSGALGRFRTAAVFASSSVLGGFGLVYALRTVIEEGRRHTTIIGQTRAALEQQGVSWSKNADEIERVINAQSKLSAFDDEDLYTSFTALFRRTGDVNEAFRLNAIVADVARGRNLGLEAAVRLVTRASIGQVGSLRRLGLDVSAVTVNTDKLRASTKYATKSQLDAAAAADKRATQERVLATLTAKYGGSAAAFARSDAGAQELFTKSLHDTEEAISVGVLPQLTQLLRHGTAYLDHLNKSGKLEKEVTHDARELGKAVHGLADAYHLAQLVIRPVITLLGGTRNAVKDLAVVLLLLKVRAFAAALGLKATGTAAVVAGDESAVAAGKVGLLGKGLRGLPSRIAIQVAIAYVAYGPLKDFFEKHLGANYQGLAGADKDTITETQAFRSARKLVVKLRKKGLTDAEIRQELESARGSHIAYSEQEIDSALHPSIADVSDRQPGRGPAGPAAPPTAFASDAHGRPRKRLSLQGRFNLADYKLAQAQAANNVKAERAEINVEISIVKQQIAVAHTLAEKTALTQQLDQLEGQVEAIDQAAQATRDQHTAARQRAAATAARKRKAAAAAAARERKAAARERAAEARKERAAQISLLTNAPVELRIAEQTALAHHASEEKLLAIYRKELAALDTQVKVIKKLGLGKDAVLAARTAQAATQKKIDALLKKSTKSAADVFVEAANEFKLYGSNLSGPGGGVLSGQDARGLLAEILLVTRDSARANKRTADHTGEISRSKPTGIHHARAGATHGAQAP